MLKMTIFFYYFIKYLFSEELQCNCSEVCYPLVSIDRVNSIGFINRIFTLLFTIFLFVYVFLTKYWPAIMLKISELVVMVLFCNFISYYKYSFFTKSL